MKRLPQIFAALLNTIGSWWTVDRVRVSPFTGRLLNLAAGDTIRIADGMYTVVSKQIATAVADSTVEVRYQLQSDSGTCELHVRRTTDGNSVGELMSNSEVSTVFDDDIIPMRAATV